jgi:anti-sigma factor RsiW
MAADATLRDQALRYAAGELSPIEVAAFEARLASDPAAREAVAEAVRLSAAVLHCPPPAPDASFRAAACERLLHPRRPRWLARRAYPGHPLVWATLGAATITAFVLLLTLLPRPAPPPITQTPQAASSPGSTAAASTATAPDTPHAPTQLSASPLASTAPSTRRDEETPPATAGASLAAPNAEEEHPPVSVAELWADMSTPERVEKARDEELRWRQKLRERGAYASPRFPTPDAAIETR